MGKIKNLLTKEFKVENYLVIILGVVAMILGFLIMSGVLTIISEAELLAKHPNAFAWVLIIVGALGILLGVYKISKKKE